MVWPSSVFLGLLTRITDHLYVRDLQMPVLAITLCHAAVLGGIFHVFLHIVHGGIRDNASRGHRVTHVFGERDLTAPYFPGTSIASGEQKFVRAFTFRQAAGDVPYVRLFLGKSERATGKNHTQKQLDFHISPPKMSSDRD